MGLSIGSDSSSESGLVVLDRDLNLIKTDKAYQLSELKSIIQNFSTIASAKGTILCVDMPKNIMMLTGKWRIESKQTQVLTLNRIKHPEKKAAWKNRFSDRGGELCKHFETEGMEVYRYNPYFTINMLRLNPPYKSRVPAACKFLQSILEEKLKINGIPANLLPLPTLHAAIGAYIGWKIAHSEEQEGYRQIGEYKGLPIVSALSV